MRALEHALAREAPEGTRPPDVRLVDDAGVPSAAKEAFSFAVLGHETLHGRPNTLPAATGARHASVLGAIWPGENYVGLMRQASRSPAIERLDRIVVCRSSEASNAESSEMETAERKGAPR
jgi:hypothetical protein